MVNHDKISNGEGCRLSLITMITPAVDNHGVENSQDTLSKSHYGGAAYNVCLLCNVSEEDMAEGGCDSSGPQCIFLHSKRTKSEVWAYFGSANATLSSGA